MTRAKIVELLDEAATCKDMVRIRRIISRLMTPIEYDYDKFYEIENKLFNAANHDIISNNLDEKELPNFVDEIAKVWNIPDSLV